jgi:hypothetical protein
MKRREVLALTPALPSTWALGAAWPWPAQAVSEPRCRHPGLGRGFHLGEVFGRSAPDFAAMAALGATLVRLGIALQPDASGQRYELHPQALPELATQLDLARAHGLRLVLVLRPAPEPEAPLWASAALQSSLEAHWRELARRLAGRAEVAAFDLVNEPHPPGLTFALKQARWDALATRLVRAVRSEDPQRTLVLEPSPGARPMAFATATPLPFERLVYSVHMYEPFEFTHQRVGDPRFTGVVDYPGPVPSQGLWNRERLQAELAPVKRFADRHGTEIYVGEFGAPRWAPGAARERYLTDLVQLFAAWGWSWTYHAWREWHGWDAEMAPGLAPTERRGTEPAAGLLRAALRDCGGAIGSR